MTEEIRQVPVKGQNISVRRLKDAQLLLLSRDAQLLARDDVSPARRLEAGGYIMDVFESAIVSDKDKKYVLDLTRQGELEIADLAGLMSVFSEDEAPTTGPEPKKVVKRGRPRKTIPAA